MGAASPAASASPTKSVAQASLPVIMGTQRTVSSRDESYRTDAFAYGRDDELFWEESKKDTMPMSSSMLKSEKIAGITETGKASLYKDPQTKKVWLVMPKTSNSFYSFDNTFHGYESGVLLYKKNLTGVVQDGSPYGLMNNTEFYTYLNGLKVGIYTEEEMSSESRNKGKEDRGTEAKTGKFFGGGAETHNYYCSYDGQGNVAQVSNMAGDMPYNLYAYDSYGTQTGSDYSSESYSYYKGYDKGPFGYKTGVRQYDPETGRFLSPDAFKGYLTDPASQHPYMYCHGNPVKYSDPSGYITGGEIAIGLGVGAAIYYGYTKSERKLAGWVGVPQTQIDETLKAIKREPNVPQSKIDKAEEVLKHFKKTYKTHVDARCGTGKNQMAKEMDATFMYDSDITFIPERRHEWYNFLVVRINGIPGQIRLYMGADGVFGGTIVKYESERTKYPVD